MVCYRARVDVGLLVHPQRKHLLGPLPVESRVVVHHAIAEQVARTLCDHDVLRGGVAEARGLVVALRQARQQLGERPGGQRVPRAAAHEPVAAVYARHVAHKGGL